MASSELVRLTSSESTISADVICTVALEATNFSSSSVLRIDSEPLRAGLVTAMVARCGEVVVWLICDGPMLVLLAEGDSLPIEGD